MRDKQGRWKAHSEVSVGDKFYRWTVLEKAGVSGSLRSHATYLCLCNCGTKRVVEGYSLTSGNSKSCGCLSTDNARKRLRTKPYLTLYKKLKDQADKAGRETLLSYEEFVQFTTITACTYCSTPVTWSEWAFNNKNIGGYNLDRKDSSLGYSKENCVVCCGDCNFAKNDKFSYDEFMLLSPALNVIRVARLEKTCQSL